ncbi:hypothetical protein BB561_003705 [Smittium simulii]|uniref:Protein ORM1 n=1 Tax=Smittium simulii TaxID=133385 RepID=A0A2T9YJX8_9FUNG|nr:hypothetical protein BB561_003705 [Smittium simulii]
MFSDPLGLRTIACLVPGITVKTTDVNVLEFIFERVFQRTTSSGELGEGTINMNSSWITSRGSWIIHLALIVLFRFIYSIIPWFSTISAWTLTNLSYCLFQYILFHATIGTPFEVNQGEFNDLTTWEQIEIGEQFTPTKKFFFVLPICLFLVSTHYCNYDVPTFFVNLIALLVILIAKLPALHRVRFFGINMRHFD